MAFGDGENDITMLKHVKTGVAMGNASDFVKEAADYVTSHIDDNGLVKALEKAEGRKSAHAKAEYLGNECEKALLELRSAVDSAEEFVAEELWPMAKYQELLTVL